MNRFLEKYFFPLREGEGSGSVIAPAPAPVTPPVADPAAPPVDPAAPPAPPPADPAAPPADPAPLSSADIKLPEGFTADEAQMTSFLEVINNKDLSPADRANKLTELYANGVKQMQETLAADWIARNKKWADEIRNDPEIGGANMEQSNAHFANVLREFGDEQLVNDLIETGAGNRLSVARFFTKIGKLMAEGKPLVGDPTSETQQQTIAQKLYPNQGKV